MSAIKLLTVTIASTVLLATGLAGCADPEPATSDNPTAASQSGRSQITTTWDQDPVDSVVALIPEEYKGRPLNNAIYNNFPPQEFLEGDTLVGIQPDIALAISEVMGVELNNMSVGTFDSLIPGVVSGRYDMSTGLFGVTQDRLKEVDFVTEFKIGTGFAVKAGSGITIEKATDLCGHSVSVIAGSYYIDQIGVANQACAAAGLEPIRLQTYPDDGARTLAVTNGRVEVTATTQDALAYIIDSQNVPLERQPLVYEPIEQAIAIPNGSDLGMAVEAAMKEIVRNGTYAKIMEKWRVQDLAYTSPNEVLYLTEPQPAE